RSSRVMHTATAPESARRRLRPSMPLTRTSEALGSALRSPATALGVVVFVAALLSRTVWLGSAPFHPDESTVLWMALDAVRHPTLPDHGLVSTYHAYQPPGLVWTVLPFV